MASHCRSSRKLWGYQHYFAIAEVWFLKFLAAANLEAQLRRIIALSASCAGWRFFALSADFGATSLPTLEMPELHAPALSAVACAGRSGPERVEQQVRPRLGWAAGPFHGVLAVRAPVPPAL